MVIDKKKDRRYQIALHILFVLMCVTAIVPMLTLVSVSLTDETFLAMNGYSIFVKMESFSTQAYQDIFATPATILNAYKTTIFIAVVGTAIYIIMISLIAYPLSRPNYRFRRIISTYLLFTMMFEGGNAATYIIFSSVYHLRNTYAVLIIHGLGGVWYVFMLRAFMQGLPQDMLEAATIDGAGQMTIYTKLVLPMCKACLAVIAFGTFRAYWDQWEVSLYYIDDAAKYTLQYLLQRMLRELDAIKRMMEMGLATYKSLPSESLRMAMVCIAIGPSIFIFPFFQKYFARGLTLGSVKG